ncbi:unnamed protein product [Paramecium pentaurelia]|uniref:Uncharacterized protein n=1 Tax=Paramecium pentaurelia TaxID=43138 RepID=A0A8S1VBF8_9CILI|nr:unnamed protein product [Paramecium pentaurelia]
MGIAFGVQIMRLKRGYLLIAVRMQIKEIQVDELIIARAYQIQHKIVPKQKLHNFYRLFYIFIPSMLRLSKNIVILYIGRRLRKFVKMQDVRVLNDEYQLKIGSCHCKWDSGNQKCRDKLCSEAGISLKMNGRQIQVQGKIRWTILLLQSSQFCYS